MNITPNANPLRIAPFDPEPPAADGAEGGGGQASGPAERPRSEDVAQVRAAVNATEEARPRVVLQFSPNVADLLLSGSLNNGQVLAGRPAAIDARLGKGHVILFAIRPFWRWQTHGTYSLGFNALMNWNDL